MYTTCLTHLRNGGSGGIANLVNIRRLLVVAFMVALADVPLYSQIPPTTTTITAVSPSPSQRSQSVTITATVSPASATGRVVFFSGAIPIGSGVLSGGTASFTTNQLPSGTNQIRATYAGDATHNHSTTAAPIALRVISTPVGGTRFQQKTLTGLNDFFFVRTADLNGDGKTDLVAANINLHGVTVSLGNGDGTFQTPVVIPTGSAASSPRALTVADFNMDGIPDIAVANGGDGTISILLGTGSGTSFVNSTQTPILIAANQTIHDIVASDFNGDGIPDLVAANEDGGSIAVFLGNGNGTFSTPISFTGLGQPFSLAAEDFNGDGKIDLAVSSTSPAQISIFLGNGLAGIFTAAAPLTGLTTNGYIVAGDFTGDGKIDIAAGDVTQTHVLTYVGSGDGRFIASAGSAANVANLAAGDFNADGVLDVATAGNSPTPGAEVHFGDSAGNFSTGFSAGSVPVNPEGMAVGDFNGDGRDDFVVGNLASTPAVIFLGVGAPASITTTSGSPQSVGINTALPTPPQVVVKDSSGTPLSSTSVTFTAPSSGASGVFTVNGGLSGNTTTDSTGTATMPAFSTNGTPGTYNISVTAGNPPVTVTNASSITLTNLGPAATITGTTESAQILFTYSPALQATVKDSAGNLLPGIAVNFTAPASGASGTFAGTGTNTGRANTNASGVATAPAFTANSTAGSYNVQASAGTVTNTTAFALTNTAGAPNSVTTTGGNGQSATVLTAFSLPLQVTVRDSGNNNAPGVSVTFTAPSSGASGTFGGTGKNTAMVTTDANGVAATTFTANAKAGTFSVSAGAASVFNANAFSLTNNSAGPASVTATAGTPQAAAIQGTFSIALQATVRDSGGNGVSGVSVTFTAPASGPSGTFAGGSSSVVAVTNASGVATATAYTANTKAGTYTVNAAVAGVGTAAAFNLTNNAGAPASVSVVAGNGQSAAIGTTFATAMQVLVIDSFGNPGSGINVTFSAPGSGPSGTFAGKSPVVILTNASGIATAPAFTANSTPGGYTVFASVAANVQAAAFNLVNNLGSSSVSVGASSNPLMLGQLLTLTATVLPATATGKVTFLFGTTVLGTAPVNGSGQASLTISPPNPGMDFVRAEYSGDSTFTRAMSPPLALTVRASATSSLTPDPAAAFAAGTNPKAVITGDFNGDGRPDLAVVNNGGNTVSILLGNGDGSFQSAVDYPVDLSPVAIAAADLNGDGKLDLVVANSNSNDVSVLLGSGNGTFQAASNFPAGGSPRALSLVELNGDGKPDLVIVVNSESSSYSVLLGNGDGTFGVPSFQGPYQLQNFTATASNGGTTSITPSSGPASSASFSYNIDLAGGGVSFRTWTFQTNAAGTGPVSFQWHYTGFHAFFAVQALFQVFADGPSGRTTITLYNPPQQNCCTSPSAGFDVQGTATINVTQGFAFGFTVGGSNFDSNSHMNGTLTISDLSAPSPPNPVALAGASGAVAIASGDFNGDGKADIAIANSGTNNVSPLLGNGDGTFVQLGNIAAGTNPSSLIIADFNGDGRGDVAVANSGSGSVSVIIGNSDGFNSAVNYATGAGPTGLVISDFNGDGALDLAVANSGGNNVSVLLGNGNGTFQTPNNYALASLPASPSVANRNRERRAETSGRGADESLQTGMNAAGAASPVALAAADLNRDGHPDLVVLNTSGGTVLLGVGSAAAIAATAGTPQNTNVNTSFAANLQATVRDNNNSPISGATVTFTAPTSGASGAFAGGTTSVQVQTNSAGVATAPVFTANNIAGQYNVTASVAGVAGTANFSLTNVGGPVISGAGSLNFTVVLPNGAAPAQAVALTGAGPVSFTLTTSTNSGGNWLAATVSGSTTPATLTVSLTTIAQQLPPGTYDGSITLKSVTDQTVVPVTLTVLVPFDSLPATLTFDYVIGAAPPAAQVLQLTSANRSISYTANPSAAWLTLTSLSGKTPAGVGVVVNPNAIGSNLQPGQYSATITIQSSFASNSPVFIAVTLNVKAQLIATPTALSFTAIAGQPVPAGQSVSVTGANGLQFSVLVSDKWLKAAVTSGVTPGAVTVSVDPTGLAVGDYTGTVQLIPSNPQAQGATVTVTLKVRAPLLVSPTSVSATAFVGIPSMPVQTITLSSGGIPVTYSVATSGESWFSVDSTRGTTPGAFKVTINPAGLSAAVYTGSITISSSQTTPPSQVIRVTLTIPTPGTPQGLESLPLQMSTPAFASPTTQTFTLVSSNQVQIPFRITTSESFVTVSPSSGVTPALITVTIDPSLLQPSNSYQASLTITSLNTTVTRNLTVSVQAPNPKLALSPPVLEVQAQAGKTGSNKFFIQNVGGGATLNYSVSVVNPQNTPFLTVGPASGTVTGQGLAAIQVTIDATKLSAGPYFTTFLVTLGNLPPQPLPVSITVTPTDPVIALDFQGVQFDVRKGEGSTVSQDVSILDIGGKSFNWKAEILSGSEFLSITRVTGTVSPGSPGTLTLSTNKDFTTAGKTAPGTYFASLRISSPDAVNSPRLFTAVLNLTDPVVVDATPVLRPTGLVFAAPPGVNPPAQNVQVFVSSQAPLAFQVSTQTYTGPDIDAGAPANWLISKVNVGTASTGSPGSVDVSVQTAGLPPGVYTGGVSVSINNVVRSVNVSLVVNQAAPVAKSGAQRLDQAACVPSKLVPTFVGGLVNNFSQQVAGPVPVTINVVDDCGNLVPNPNDPTSPKADVTIQFSTGDPSAKTMLLTDPKRAAYTITWVPDIDAPNTQVTVQARLGDLSGNAQSNSVETAAAPAAGQATLIGGLAKVSGTVLAGVGPVLQPNATLNNLNPQRGAALAPGAVIQIFGVNLTPTSPASFETLPLPTSLNGTTVLIGGIPAPLFYLSKNQINAQVPFELASGRQYEVQVNVNGALTTPDQISLVEAAPGIAAAADGTVLAQHTNGDLVTADNPAAPNEAIVIYLVGMGRTVPPVSSGAAAPTDQLAQVAIPPTVTLDGSPAGGVLFAGLSPGFVGLYQINFTVPAGTAAGARQLVVTQGGSPSNTVRLPVGLP